MLFLLFLTLGLVGGVVALEGSYRLARLLSAALLRLDAGTLRCEAGAQPAAAAIVERFDV